MAPPKNNFTVNGDEGRVESKPCRYSSSFSIAPTQPNLIILLPPQKTKTSTPPRKTYIILPTNPFTKNPATPTPIYPYCVFSHGTYTIKPKR